LCTGAAVARHAIDTAIGIQSFARFTRSIKLKVWHAVYEKSASLGLPADKVQAIDSTIVRGHRHAAGAKRGSKKSKRSAAASPPGT